MVQPLIGIKLPNRPFVPLLRLGSATRKRVVLSGKPNTRTSIPIILCRNEENILSDENTRIGSLSIEIPADIHSERSSFILEIGLEKDAFLSVDLIQPDTGISRRMIFRLAEVRTQSSSELPYGAFIYSLPTEHPVLFIEEKESDDLIIEPESQTNWTEEDLLKESDVLQEPEELSNIVQSVETEQPAQPEYAVPSAQSALWAPQENTGSVNDDYYTLADKSTKPKYRISVKLISIISLIVVSALGLITMLVSYYVTNDVRISAEENNLAINSRTAAEAANRLQTIQMNVRMFLDMSGTAPSEQTVSVFFERNKDIAAVIVPDQFSLFNSAFFFTHELSKDGAAALLEAEHDAVLQAAAGIPSILNISPYFSYPLIAMIYPYELSDTTQVLIILFSPEALSETFGINSVNSSYMVNNEGIVIAHPDNMMIIEAVNMSSNPIVQEMRENGYENRQLLYDDGTGEQYFGAYSRLQEFADAGIITLAQASVIFESVKATTRRNIYLTVAVLAISILVIWFFSKTISTPVKALAAAAQEIKKGKFELNLKPHTQDELGLLTESFVSMGKGLAERERLKETFGRFINKDIAEKAMRGELTLGGETKITTVFFSDIRAFTAISEKLEPAEVVEFLNDYMTRMVECVNKTGGVVDKFMGDAVMAVWGAPVSAGSPEQDALQCVRSALMMRSALIEFNKDRGSNKKPIIRIGCGINTGPVVAGQIGSTERMEYTVIGDAVNFASRTESLNKPLGTDILITENTYELIKDHILAEQMPSLTVKGKEKPVKIFAVINMPQEQDIPGTGRHGPQSLHEIREMLGIPEPDFSGVNLDEEEKKYQIQEK